MEDLEKTASRNWSALRTVTSIDRDIGSAGREIVPRNGHLFKLSAKSLIIESLVDQLCKLLEHEPQRRKRIYEGICNKLFEMNLVDETYKIEELSSLRGYYQQAMINLLKPSEPSLYKISTPNFEWSRYLNEYEELGFIAAGGFGKVFKVKHKLDQAYYAVKKIHVTFKSLSVLIMESNEVKTLARLNHPNIVQYKAAWLEPVMTATSALPITDGQEYLSSSSDEIVFAESSVSTFSEEGSSSNTDNEMDLRVCKYNNCDLSRNPAKTQISATLYVSMQLCDETLREWLNKRNHSGEQVNLPVCINIMIQAAKGLEYIHSCNIVHHDIKPSNIFLSNNLNHIQVGDFGLSCCLQGHSHSTCPLEGGRFGTPLYASPEQHKRQCHFKGDMYSLGIVFIELVSIFTTEMERVSVLKKSRMGLIPNTVPAELVPIIKKLISLELDERPSSTELLEMLYKLPRKLLEQGNFLSFSNNDVITRREKNRVDSVSQTSEYEVVSVNSELDDIIRLKDREISELKLMLAKKEDEIAQLKRHLHQDVT